MKRAVFSIIIFLSTFLILSSCGQDNDKTSSVSAEVSDTLNVVTNDTAVTFSKVNVQAILFGNSIKLLDRNFKEVKDISFLNEQIVDVVELSDSFQKANPVDDYCQKFRYAKIKTKDIEGYVDGRKVYKLMKDNELRISNIGQNEISLTPTHYFGTGVSDDDGLTGCSINTPALFFDRNENFVGPVKMIKNENYKGDYPYFELMADDGAEDEIMNIDKQEGKYMLSIERQYQEGAADISVSIYKNSEGVFVAEILEYLEKGEPD